MMKYKPNLSKRILATLIDYTLFLLVTTLYIYLFGKETETGAIQVKGAMTWPIIIAWLFYFVVLESWQGATPAHDGLHMKVVQTNGKAIDWVHSLKRHLLDPVDILFYGIPAYIAIKYSDKHQRLGDMWAGTVVIDTKDPEQYPVNYR